MAARSRHFFLDHRRRAGGYNAPDRIRGSGRELRDSLMRAEDEFPIRRYAERLPATFELERDADGAFPGVVLESKEDAGFVRGTGGQSIFDAAG